MFPLASKQRVFEWVFRICVLKVLIILLPVTSVVAQDSNVVTNARYLADLHRQEYDLVAQTVSASSIQEQQSTLQCDPPIYYGVIHCKTINDDVQIIQADLRDSHVQVQTALPLGFNGECDSVNHKGKDSRSTCAHFYDNSPSDPKYPFEKMKDMLERYRNDERYRVPGKEAVAIINADYFGTDGDHGAQGLAVRNGVRLDGETHNDRDTDEKGIDRWRGSTQPSLAISPSPSNNVTIGVPGSEQVINGNLSGTYYNAVGGAPIIVRNKVLDNITCSALYPGDPYPGEKCSQPSQSAAGLTDDGHLILITAKKNAAGVAQYLIDNYQVDTALKFDGGGSARLAWVDSDGNIASFGGYDGTDLEEDRAVAEGLIIFSEKLKIEDVGSGVDVALIIDSTGSMSSNDPGGLRKNAAKALVDISQPGDKIAVISFNTGAYRLAALTEIKPGSEQQLVKAELRRAIDFVGQDGNTDLNVGLNSGFTELLSDTSNQRRAAVFLTDGEQTSGLYNNNSHLQYTNKGWPVYTVGFGQADFALLSRIAAETQGECLNGCQSFTDLGQLQLFYHDVLQRQIANGSILLSQSSLLAQGESKQLAASLPPGQDSATFLAVWPGSQVDLSLSSPSGRVIDANTVSDDVYHSKQSTYETFTVQNPEVGAWRVNVYGASLAAAGEQVDVRVSSRGLRMPSLFLPNIRYELPAAPPVCSNGTFTPVDVMFALDRSESFAEQNRIGRSKVAIIAFMDKIVNTGEQVALTKFNKVVELSQPLTTDKQAVYNLLVNVPEAEGTAIGDAIKVAADELLGPRHVPGHRPVLIVFSDGENTDGSDPLKQANAAKARGIRIFTVSSWENVDGDGLRKLASSPADYYYTEGTHDMAESARVIADRVRCGD